MQTLAEIKELLESRGLRPKRSLGQNFLVDHNMIRKLVDASGVGKGSLVLEIGPGTGTMTEELLARGCEVIACELDDALAALNRERLPTLLPTGESHRFTLVHGDCLADRRTLNAEVVRLLHDSHGTPRPFALVANLPYGAATPLMVTLLLDYPQCASMSVTIQKELGDRLLAKPRTKDYGPISIIAQLACDITRVATAPGGCFWPPPEVTSSLVHLARRSSAAAQHELARVSELCDVLFQQRRKQLGSLWKEPQARLGLPTWEQLGAIPELRDVSATSRAEELSPEQVLAMARTWITCTPDPSRAMHS